MREKQYYIRWLSAAIARTGITQAELGRRVGLERDQVNRLLTGKRKWTESLVERLAQALSVPLPDYGTVSGVYPLSVVPMMGTVNHSVWTEGTFTTGGDVTIPEIPNTKFAGMPQTAYRVDVDIPGTRVTAGTYVITVDLKKSRPNGYLIGDMIICERRRDVLVSNVIGVASRPRNGSNDLQIETPSMNPTPTDLIPTRLVIGLFAQLA